MSECMAQEDAMNMNAEQAIQILKPMQSMMRDQHGCPISDAYFALEKAIEALEQKADAVCVVRCRECENWIQGYIADNDDFIPPKCGKYQQMVGHCSDDYCSLAKRRSE